MQTNKLITYSSQIQIFFLNLLSSVMNLSQDRLCCEWMNEQIIGNWFCIVSAKIHIETWRLYSTDFLAIQKNWHGYCVTKKYVTRKNKKVFGHNEKGKKKHFWGKSYSNFLVSFPLPT